MNTSDKANTQVWMRTLPAALLNLDVTKTLNVQDISRVINVGNDNGAFLLNNRPVYKPLIDALTKAGFVEYNFRNNQWDPDGRPTRITGKGCDKTQNKATLFIFPYDWRKLNETSATNLKDYIDCIRQIYPDVKVDIVAHSMGGLIARRMILNTNTQAANQPHPFVNKLITLGTPFWGSPLANFKMEEGHFLGSPELSAAFGWSQRDNLAVRDTVRVFPAAHQLLPSKALFDNTPANRKPFGEGLPGILGLLYWDINSSNAREADYAYAGNNPQGYKVMMDTRFTALANVKPMTNNEDFHGFVNNQGNQQDDWGKDSTGVTYYHIVGIGKDTAVKTHATLFLGLRWGGPFRLLIVPYLGTTVYNSLGDGDDTVPRMSAERTAAANAAPAGNIRVLKGKNGTTHLELVQKPDPINCVLQFLGLGNKCPDGEKKFEVTLAPASERIEMTNVQNVAAYDALGNRIDIQDGQDISKFGVTSGLMTLPPGQEAFVFFNTLDDPYASSLIRVMTKDDTETDLRKIVYLDPQTRFDRPPEQVNGILGMLHVDGFGNTTLQFDWNQDGIIDGQDQIVAPTVDTSYPSMVSDEDGPYIFVTNMYSGPDGLTHVTLGAYDPSGLLMDTGIGTRPFVVSLQYNGTVIDNLVDYTIGTDIGVPPGSLLTACAVDAVGNRTCQFFNIP